MYIRAWVIACLTTAFMVGMVGVAWAADVVPPDNRTLALPELQLWTLLAGCLVPGVTYVLNKHAPWMTDPVKGFVHVVTASIAGALVVLIDTGDIGLNNETFQAVFTAVVAAFGAHAWFWKPTGLGPKLGAGQNAQDTAGTL